MFIILNMKSNIIAVFFLLALFSSAAEAQIYQYTDESGQKWFTNQLPEKYQDVAKEIIAQGSDNKLLTYQASSFSQPKSKAVKPKRAKKSYSPKSRPKRRSKSFGLGNPKGGSSFGSSSGGSAKKSGSKGS